MKMWSTYRKDVIKSRLLQIMESGDKVTVWQSRDEEKIKFEASLIEVTDSNTVIELEDSYRNADYKITKDKPLFIHSFYLYLYYFMTHKEMILGEWRHLNMLYCFLFLLGMYLF